MGFTRRELKAVDLLCKTHEARPMLTVSPEVTIQVKATGELIKKPIADVLAAYDEHRAMVNKERARLRREAAARYSEWQF